jgi:hypothetical protein
MEGGSGGNVQTWSFPVESLATFFALMHLRLDLSALLTELTF